MKTIFKSLFLMGIFSISSATFAQAPEGVNYQAVVRDASGALITNQSVDVIFNILSGSISGAAVYSENQTLTTNNYGGFSAIIGQGIATSGTFSSITWGNDSYFLNVIVDGDDLGTTQFLSVPYALHAKTASSLTNPIWQEKVSNGDYYTQGEPVIIGDSIADAEKLTVSSENVNIVGELVDLRVDTLDVNNDILNIYAGSMSADNSQLIECNKGWTTVFKVNTDGKVFSTNDITTEKNLIVSEEVQTTATSDANMIPIAYGRVTGAGVLQTGSSSNNVTVQRTSNGTYFVTIAGITYNSTDYITIGTRYSNSPGFIYTSTGGTDLYYYLDNSAGTPTDTGFSFVVYKK